MKGKLFAAIDVGSYELNLKIYNVTANGMSQVDDVRYRLDLGSDTYAKGKIENERVEELCKILKEFKAIMGSYKVDDYKAYATSAIRETQNTVVLLDLIEQRTGVKLEVLSNSEQRFLDYKSVASKGEVFNRIIEKGTAIVDIGGGSVQISLFDKDTLVTTQNIRLGILRIRERLSNMEVTRSHYAQLIDEMVEAQIDAFKKLYLKDRQIENIIVVDDYLSYVIQRSAPQENGVGCVDVERYENFLLFLREKNMTEIARTYGMTEDNALLLAISSMLLKQIVHSMDAKYIWAPGVTLCDGMAYEYAENRRIFALPHDFEQDIIACARNISKRYMGSKKRSETLEMLVLTIFDSMKRIHGLGKRERLMLRLAALLHDCGRYISLTNLGECGYDIIMSTEIIGLSHLEREIVANVVRYNHMELDSYEELGKTTTLDRKSYLVIAKLTAILRVANGLDRSHKEKFRNVSVGLQKDELIITVKTNTDITLEQGLFEHKAQFFEEVYSIKPVIRQKRVI